MPDLSNTQKLAAFLIVIAFPCVVAWFAHRKGQDTVALVTFLSVFVGLGPFVALMALWKIKHL